MMKRVAVAEFRKSFTKITEPTEVVRYPNGPAHLVGTWYPVGTVEDAPKAESPVLAAKRRDEILRRINKK